MESKQVAQMQFIHRVRAVWPWLPAFRAVAETEHLPTAARELDLVPSSLSRAIKQLEDAIGVELFDHASKALVLDQAGEILLAAVRKSMRLLDEALCEITGTAMAGCATLVTCPAIPSRVLPLACLALHEKHPDLKISTRVADDAEIDALLLRGAVDVALVANPRRDSTLSCDALASWPRGVFRAATAPPATAPRFVVVGDRARTSDDGWPSGEPREIAMWTHDEQLALALCAGSNLAVVATARAAAAHPGLARMPAEIPDQKIFLTRRHSLGAHPRTDALIDAVRDAIARV